MEFDSKLAVVTGAAGGIGCEVAARLGAEGARLILVDRDEAALLATAARLRDSGADATTCVCDLTDGDEVMRMRAAVDAAGGRLQVLVTCAGAWRYGSFLDAPDEDFDWSIAVNTRSLWLSLRSLADTLIASGDARVVNVLSTAAFRPRPDLPLYAAAKAAAMSLTRSAAGELAPHGVLVNGVAPGPVATAPALARDPDLKQRANTIPLGRVGEADDIAELIVFLASSRNRFMCGETVLINGGNYMG